MSSLMQETLRYLGCKGTADEQTLQLADSCLAELATVVTPRSTHRLFAIERSDSGITIATIRTQSRGLARNLEGCDMAFVMAATLGSGVDRLIRTSSVGNMARTVVLQAAATAMVEQYCDNVCDELAAEPELAGRRLRPRFSPGYGDLELDCQRTIADLLGCHRIGLSVTESLMLAPSKSVTAIVGAGQGDCCHPGGCNSCNKIDCTFRR